jgi:arabinose-5-phosphate isomerase
MCGFNELMKPITTHDNLNSSQDSQLRYAAEILLAEADAVAAVADCLDSEFTKAVMQIAKCEGSIVVSGVGKSGLIGRKISATLASTGTSSHFMHPTEAMHGDFGSVKENDTLILLSFSGQTDEVVALAAVARQVNLPVISMTGTIHGRLAKLAAIQLTVGDITEACPHQLAPTASTTAMLALGDALALCVSRERKFTAADFYRRHPDGGLGKLMLPLGDAVRFRVGKNLPVVSDALTVKQVLTEIDQEQRRVGATLLIDDDGKLTGIFTDADFRRLISQQGVAALDSAIADQMTRRPKVLFENDLVRDAVQVMLEKRIDEIPLVDDAGKPTGLIDVQDLIALGVMIED